MKTGYYVVSTDIKPEAGVAEVRGQVVRPEEIGSRDMGVIFADSVSVSQAGQSVSLREFQQNTIRILAEWSKSWPISGW